MNHLYGAVLSIITNATRSNSDINGRIDRNTIDILKGLVRKTLTTENIRTYRTASGKVLFVDRPGSNNKR